ncbi:MAG: phosphatase PAP2 family protein [Clostridia bacterium]|nr:phosphatase PAP2 family protein [Clostridia bacterium]
MIFIFEYYRDFNFKNITSVKYRHLFLILFWPVYLSLFIFTEKFVTPIYNVYCPLDDLIPFCEFFVIPYVLWYALLAFVSLYTLFFDIPSFKKFYWFLSITCIITFSLYIIFPNMQNLRPQEFARDNIFVDVMKNLYAIDTNTNVCPSIHVIFSLGMLFTMWNSKHFNSTLWRIAELIIAVSICLATVFLKQHSVIDIFAGVALSFIVLPFVTKINKKSC